MGDDTVDIRVQATFEADTLKPTSHEAKNPLSYLVAPNTQAQKRSATNLFRRWRFLWRRAIAEAIPEEIVESHFSEHVTPEKFHDRSSEESAKHI